MEFNQEINDQKENEENKEENTPKQWLQDNLRIIISVLVVILIAGGIYSYSKRTQAPTGSQEPIIMSDEATPDTTGQVDQSTDQKNQAGQSNQSTSNATSQVPAKDNVSTPAVSQETEISFVQTAQKGDGVTNLARAALANYLEKNPDSAISAEHKIYIEDYLRKNVDFGKKVYVGTSVEFSKELIKTAISQSKTLTPNQLQNLHKYVLRVPSLS